jgi:hypothetical protein
MVVAEAPEDSRRGVRPTDEERQAATHRLIRACSEGRLTLAEFEKRVEAVLAAPTGQDIDKVTGDVPIPTAAAAPARPMQDRRWSLSFVGGLHRRGGWQIPKHLIHLSFIGGTSIDLGDAELSSAETTITLVSLLGGANLRVPNAVRTEVSGFTFVGGRHVTGSPSVLPDAPLVHFRVYSLIGGTTLRPSGPRWRRFALTR